MAGAASSTADFASTYCAPSMMSAHPTRSARSGASNPYFSRATVAMNLVHEREVGS